MKDRNGLSCRASDIDTYADTGNSCPDLRAQYNVGIREYVILAYLGDSGATDFDSLSRGVALSRTTTADCLENLIANDLVRYADNEESTFLPTVDGLALLQKSCA